MRKELIVKIRLLLVALLLVALAVASLPAAAKACTGVYVPWYMGIRDVPRPYKTETDEVSKGSAWWAFRELDSYVDAHYAKTIPTVRAAFGTFQGRMLADQAGFERMVAKVYKRSPSAGSAVLTAYSGYLGMKAYCMARHLLKKLEKASRMQAERTEGLRASAARRPSPARR